MIDTAPSFNALPDRSRRVPGPQTAGIGPEIVFLQATDRALSAQRETRGSCRMRTERYRRRDFGHMDLEITFDDPKYYTRPFSIKAELFLVPDSELLEYVCGEHVRVRTRLAN